MLQVLVSRLAKNKNIIKIDHNKFSQKGFQNLGHEPHECRWCIRQTEWHN
uniref:Uncharacterized protein n=1 Tax=Rhizophora mucronata TaxID=61149 RepID=A0A2P2MXE5_RHIMU